MAVVFDAISSPADQTANTVVGTTGFTTSGGLITVGSGANRALVVAVNFNLLTVASVAVTWDTGGTNQAMTLIVAKAGTTTAGDSQLWGLVAPTSGNKNLKVTWIGTSDIIVAAVSWTGVDQTGGVTTFPNSGNATGSTSSPALTITSATGNATVSCMGQDASTISSTGNTQIYLDNTPANISGAGERAAGAATVSHTYTLASNANWVVIGTDILAGGAATRGLFLNDQMTGDGIGGSYFRNPLAAPVGFARRDRIFVPARFAA